MNKLCSLSITLFTVFALSGCAVRTSLVAELDDGSNALIGEAVATLSSGTFELSNLDGLACNGSYDQYTQTVNLKTSFTCNDGRTGQVTILRTGTNMTNGSGVGKLSDGTTMRILMGDMVHYRGAQGIWSKAKVDDK